MTDDHESELSREELEAELVRKERELQDAQRALAEITDRVGYRLLTRLGAFARKLAPWGTRRGGLLLAVLRAMRIVLTEGWVPLLRRIPQWRRWLPRLWEPAPPTTPMTTQYQDWLARHALTEDRRRRIRDDIARMAHHPLISIVMPTYNTDTTWLWAAVDSVRGQLYDNWELCIADDGSTSQKTKDALRSVGALDERIKVKFLDHNAGISVASNAALAIATGEFVGLMDHDDEITPDALYEVVKVINRNPRVGLIYSDEDKKDPAGRRVEPFFKPGWSPDLLLQMNFMTHFNVFRKDLIEQVGGFRKDFDGSQDWDLELRVSEVTDQIEHIPLPLYSWRMVPGSSAGVAGAKPYAYGAAKRAIQEALERRGIEGEVQELRSIGRFRVRYRILGNPKIAIIIPTRDRLDLLEQCIDSIREKSSYRNFEIVIVDNNSREQETLEYLSSFDGRVIRYPDRYNFSAINNLAARQVDADMLLFLNNDTEVLASGWLEAMLEHAQRPEVGAVGARLLFPDGLPQHEGVLVDWRGHRHLPGHLDHKGYLALGAMVRNLSAVTAACMMTRAECFWQLGGFDEELAIAYNDVDYCLKLRDKGYLIVYTPHAELRHYEGASRGKHHPMGDDKLFRTRWFGPNGYTDPYYNPNLSWSDRFTIRPDSSPNEESGRTERRLATRRADTVSPTVRRARQGFRTRAPWVTAFNIEGHEFGGDYRAFEDIRVDQFFEAFPHAQSILELGSLEGGHSLVLAQNPGMTVTAVEGRPSNIEKANFVKDLVGADNVRFVCADLEKEPLESFGSRFDAVFCVGLLYHLPKPWLLLDQLRDVTSNVFMWTHYAAEDKAVDEFEGRRGMWYRELGLEDPLSGLSARSFWLPLPDLVQYLRDKGFEKIDIIHDEKQGSGKYQWPNVTLAASLSD